MRDETGRGRCCPPDHVERPNNPAPLGVESAATLGTSAPLSLVPRQSNPEECGKQSQGSPASSYWPDSEPPCWSVSCWDRRSRSLSKVPSTERAGRGGGDPGARRGSTLGMGWAAGGREAVEIFEPYGVRRVWTDEKLTDLIRCRRLVSGPDQRSVGQQGDASCSDWPTTSPSFGGHGITGHPDAPSAILLPRMEIAAACLILMAKGRRIGASGEMCLPTGDLAPIMVGRRQHSVWRAWVSAASSPPQPSSAIRWPQRPLAAP